MRQDYLNLICVRIQLKSSDPNNFPPGYIKLGSWDNLRRSLSKRTSFALWKNSCPLLISKKTTDGLILAPEALWNMRFVCWACESPAYKLQRWFWSLSTNAVTDETRCTFSSLCCCSFFHYLIMLYNNNYCIVHKLSFSLGILLDFCLLSNLPFSANALEKAEVGLDNMILSAVLCIVREISVKLVSRSW